MAPLTRRAVRLVAVAGIALAVGALVYAADRGGDAMLLPRAAAHGGLPLFGAAGAWLPSFVHPFAFSLLTAAAWPPAPRRAVLVCAAWCALNLAFEAAQHPALQPGALAAARALPHGAGEPLALYVRRGSFDWADAGAAVLGSLAALGLLRRV